MRSRPAAAVLASVSHTITSAPPRAQTSAIPEPMSPAPTTPTRSIPTSALSLILVADQFGGRSVRIDSSGGDSADHAIEAWSATDGIGLLGNPLEHDRAQLVPNAQFAPLRQLPGGLEVTAVGGDRVDEFVEAVAVDRHRRNDGWRPVAVLARA